MVDGDALLLCWPARADVGRYLITRANPDGTLTPQSELPGSATSMSVTDIQPGGVYEWRFKAELTSGGGATGFLRGGIDVPLTENRGRVLVCVAASLSVRLSAELGRLRDDLVGDGWLPELVAVSSSMSVSGLKALIVNKHSEGALAAIYLLGNLPVPYSGSIAPDAHPEHRGAWPADVYYADIDGVWTDEWRVSTSGAWPRIHNTIGDGKFDQSGLPSDADVMLGRVDLSDLPTFTLSETELLRRYLDRNHAFRHCAMPVPGAALVDDHLAAYPEGLATTARSGFASVLGRGAVTNGDWPDAPGSATYLMGAGISTASWAHINGVGSTASFASGAPGVVFSLFFGSYFGDWDTSNNVMRAALAADGVTLAAGYSGRPQWQVHGLGLGAPLGDAARESQNAQSNAPYFTSYYARQVHVALHGDPTLRLFPRPGVVALGAWREPASVQLGWDAPADADDDPLGYHVYRSTSIDAPRLRLNESLLERPVYRDTDPLEGDALYHVCAVYRETTGSGSFLNNSQAAFAELGEGETGWTASYQAFADSTFGSDAGDPQIAAPSADPDGDKSANLLEYALASPPLEAGGAALESGAGVEVEDVVYRSFRYLSNTAASGVELFIELSADLAAWSQVEGSLTRTETAAPGTEQVEVLIPAAAFLDGRVFVRLTARMR